MNMKSASTRSRQPSTAFLNAVDPEGENPKQPWTKVQLWNEKNDPLLNHHQGQILYVDNAKDGHHYVLADSLWSDKPMMFVNGFQYAYFINSLTNGGVVGEKQRVRKSPLDFDVRLTDRFYKFSPIIDTGSYALNDSNYAFLVRQNVEGLFFPSQNEWIKAAYFAGHKTENKTDYFYFPTASNKAPVPLFTKQGKEQGSAKGPASKSKYAVVNVTDTGEVLVDELSPKAIKKQGYSNYDYGVFWQPWYAPSGKTYKKANVTDVGGSASPSPWLAYDRGAMLSSTPIPSLVLSTCRNRRRKRLVLLKTCSGCLSVFALMAGSRTRRGISSGSPRQVLAIPTDRFLVQPMNTAELV